MIVSVCSEIRHHEVIVVVKMEVLPDPDVVWKGYCGIICKVRCVEIIYRYVLELCVTSGLTVLGIVFVFVFVKYGGGRVM